MFEDLLDSNKLKLSGAEVAEVQEYFDFLRIASSGLYSVSLEDVEPMVHLAEVENILRMDAAMSNFTREELLSTAPLQNEGFYVVPKVVE